MAYADGEVLILARVQACEGHSTANTSRADWKVLNSGRSDHYAILRPGQFSIQWITPCVYVARWTTVVEVWQRYVDETTTMAKLYEHVAEILNGLLPWPTLGDTSGRIERNASVTGAAEPREAWIKDGAPGWLKWELLVVWNEEVTVAYQD